MLFKYSYFPAIKRGEITRTYRAWKRPQVKEGGRYRLDREGVLEVEGLSQVRVSDITRRDAKAAGFASTDELVRQLRKTAPITSRSRVYRVDFRYVPDAYRDDTNAQNGKLNAAEADELMKRLAKMDRLSKHGAWTSETLAIIEKQPRVVASKLAARLGRERDPFKVDVRKLKKLGLTISHEVGYVAETAVARLAGVMAAKRTHDLIPLCHPLLLTDIEVEITPNEADSALDIEATVRTTGKTGVEMEALTAVSIAALTIYDMCKAVDRGMRIEGVRLVKNTGGKSGDIVLE